ncbi:MAG TPA: hypothetical protein ENN33_11645 [Ignavibacteria bacterium]|nr:hypothetical protein [Ignavibacteria bacterium]
MIDWEGSLGYYIIGEDFGRIEDFKERGYAIIRCDASYKGGLGTCSISIETKNKAYKSTEKSFREKGSTRAELKSIYYSLMRLRNLNFNNVLILNDNQYAVSLVSGFFKPQTTREVCSKINKELKNSQKNIKFGLVRSKLNRKVDQSAKKQLRKYRKDQLEKYNERVKRVNCMITESQKHSCEKVNGGFSVITESGRKYLVSFDDLPTCNCYYWRKNWENKAEKIVKSKALPCSHICCAAEFSERDVFEIFEHQITGGIKL